MNKKLQMQLFSPFALAVARTLRWSPERVEEIADSGTLNDYDRELLRVIGVNCDSELVAWCRQALNSDYPDVYSYPV